mmetsp:Transcript_114864/g.223143  ORF Transcript_114864/g.223143 Transcript_114864/m.223143 type:complete len:299 (+) Transcript_114864:92-988(+)
MNDPLPYASVPLDPPEVQSDSMIQTNSLQWRRRAFVAALACMVVMFVAPFKLSLDGVSQQEGHDEWHDEWMTLVENTSSNGSDNGSANDSADEPNNESANVSANDSAQCTEDWQGCLTSKCCVSEGYRCYKKNDHWAQCRNKCTPGIDPHDQQAGVHVQPWSCDDWDSTPHKCAGSWEGCLNTKCCKDPKQRCFKKNDHWAQCRNSCKPGIDEHDRKMGKHVGNWSCEKFDDTPLPANCSKDAVDSAENCLTTRCCMNPNSKCFKKDDGWAACNETCTEAIWDKDPAEHRRKWTCDIV